MAAEEGQVLGCHTIEEWKNHFQKGVESKKLVDVDELEAVDKEFKVEAMPTFVFLKDGQEVDRVVGARKEDLIAKIGFHGILPALDV